MPDEIVRLIRVFVSSPGDVKAERDTVEDVVASINRGEGAAAGFRLEVFRWETGVTPQIGPGPKPVVDAQLPVYDIYLGIMSTRFGTPTGRHGSGTQKEFKDALKRWKTQGAPWITFYFNAKPQLGGDVAGALQFAEVCKFRKQLQKLGIIATYEGVSGTSNSFREQIGEHLRAIVRRLVSAQTTKPTRRKKATEPKKASTKKNAPDLPIPAAYLKALAIECADPGLDGLKQQQSVAIAQHYQFFRIAEMYAVLIASFALAVAANAAMGRSARRRGGRLA